MIAAWLLRLVSCLLEMSACCLFSMVVGSCDDDSGWGSGC